MHKKILAYRKILVPSSKVMKIMWHGKEKCQIITSLHGYWNKM